MNETKQKKKEIKHREEKKEKGKKNMYSHLS